MSNWKDVTRNSWSFSRSLIAGYGGGVGKYSTSYAINLEKGQFLNGIVSARIKLPARGMVGGGLICRANEEFSFITFNVAPDSDTDDNTILRLSYFKQGLFHPVVSLKEKIKLDTDYNLFSLEFISAEIRGELVTSQGKFVLQRSIPDLSFPGYVGVVKYYGTSASVKDFTVEQITMRPTRKDETPEMTKPKYDAFISHSSADKQTVMQLIDDFNRNGITYWVDHEQITFGDRITEKIEEGLQQSKHVIVCLSSNLGRSNWCRAEYGPILQRSFNRIGTKKAIPIRFDNCTDEEIPLLLYDVNRVDYADKARFNELLDFLKRP